MHDHRSIRRQDGRGPGRGERGRTRGIALALTLALLAGAVPVFAQGQGVPREALPELPRPEREFDLALPTQEIFQEWPPRALLERPYWLPWGRQAFQRAALFGRPVLFVMAVRWNRLSQRMMNETLSDPRVLAAANDAYITVIVNPDRRPDIRERYQTGTWPVVAFLMPDGSPILSRANEAGVARPITTGRMDVDSMLFLLREGDIYFDRWAPALAKAGEEWMKRELADEPEPGEVTAAASDAAARWLLASADRKNGGFGLAPKLVLPGLYEFALLREARLHPAVEQHGRLTLEQLVVSPLYDRREGGVHRLAAGPEWSEIQYEKMLEPNVHLLRELGFALRRKDASALREALAGTAGFVTSVLARPEGGFFLGQCADPTSDSGGAYWVDGTDTPPPIDPLVLAGPNATAGIALLRAAAQLDDEELEEAGLRALELVRDAAYAKRRGVDHVIEDRPAPHRFLATQADVALAFVEAYQLIGDPAWLEAARDIAEFTLDNLWLEESPLLFDHLPGPSPVGLQTRARRPILPNVRLARALLRLWHLSREPRFFERAHAILGGVAGDLPGYRSYAIEPGLAIEEAIQEPVQVRVAGDWRSSEPRALRRAVARSAWPWTIVSSAPAEGPPTTGAVLSWRGREERVAQPAELAEALDRLTGGLEAGR